MPRLEELRAELEKYAAQIEHRRKLAERLDALRSEREELTKKARELKIILEKEEGDVSRMERTSAAAIVYAILGRKEEKLDKEKREAYAARLKYDAAVRELEDCKSRFDSIMREKDSLAGAERDYARTFEEVKGLLKDEPEYARKLGELESRLGEAKEQLREINEALSAGSACMSEINSIESSLSSAKGWGTWDIMGGGLLSDLAKHSHLDEAQAGAERLQARLSRFRSELADVRINPHLGQVNVDGFLRFADYFFDGLIADWSVLSRISSSQNSVAQVSAQVSDAMSRLYTLRVTQENEAAALERELAALVRGRK